MKDHYLTRQFSSYFLKLGLLLILITPLNASSQLNNFFNSNSQFRGDQFLTGSNAVDAVSYAKYLLEDSQGFEVDARWFPSQLMIRPTDKYGVTLPGPSGKGYEDGSVMRYKLGFSVHGERFSGFFAMDYFVASHIQNFFTLWNPFAGFGAPFTGAGGTGFAAKAGQIMPGFEYKFPDYQLAIRAGYIFKFRDPIDESGLFLSHYIGKGGYVGRYDHGDYGYAGKEAMPKGVSGLNSSEPYISIIYQGTELNTLFANKKPALLQLQKTFTPKNEMINYITPGLSYVASNYHVYGPNKIIRYSQDIEFEFNKLKVMPYLDLGLSPFQLFQFRTAMNYKGLEVGASLINVIDEQNENTRYTGLRFGYTAEVADIFKMSFMVSKNYSDFINSDIIYLNALLYEFFIRFNINKSLN